MSVSKAERVGIGECMTPEVKLDDKDWDCITWQKLEWPMTVTKYTNIKMFLHVGKQMNVNHVEI